jgi:16S rRNA processing protein RimM
MNRFFIAQIGKTVGLRGDLKLHLHTDFPEQFKTGHHFQSDRGELEITHVDLARGTIRFRGYESRESARALTNAKLYADREQTLEQCRLEEGEHFWFEIIGASIAEGDEILGEVTDIQRLVDADYLLVKTDSHLTKEGLPTTFMVPYIPRYILEADTAKKTIHTRDTKAILEAS